MNNIIAVLTRGRFGCPKVEAGRKWVGDESVNDPFVTDIDFDIVDEVKNGFVNSILIFMITQKI